MVQVIREYYPIGDAATALECEVGDLYHMAGANRLSLYVDLYGYQADSASVGVSGEVCEPVAQRLNQYTSKITPGPGINLRRTVSVRGEVLDFRRLNRGARLTIWGGEGVSKNNWQGASVSLHGFWQVAGAHFEWWERGNNDTLGDAMLRAYAMDSADSFINVSGVALPPIQDVQFWVMGDDLRRLCSAPEVLPAHQEPIDPHREMVEWARAEFWAEGKRSWKASTRVEAIRGKFNITKQRAEQIERDACPPEVMAERLKRSPCKK